MATWITGGVMAVLVFFAVRSVVRQSKTGGCSGCGGCAGCGGNCGCHIRTSSQEENR